MRTPYRILFDSISPLFSAMCGNGSDHWIREQMHLLNEILARPIPHTQFSTQDFISLIESDNIKKAEFVITAYVNSIAIEIFRNNDLATRDKLLQELNCVTGEFFSRFEAGKDVLKKIHEKYARKNIKMEQDDFALFNTHEKVRDLWYKSGLEELVYSLNACFGDMKRYQGIARCIDHVKSQYRGEKIPDPFEVFPPSWNIHMISSEKTPSKEFIVSILAGYYSKKMLKKFSSREHSVYKILMLKNFISREKIVKEDAVSRLITLPVNKEYLFPGSSVACTTGRCLIDLLLAFDVSVKDIITEIKLNIKKKVALEVTIEALEKTVEERFKEYDSAIKGRLR